MISTEYTLRASHAGLSFSLRSRLGRHDQPIVCFWPQAAVPECLLSRHLYLTHPRHRRAQSPANRAKLLLRRGRVPRISGPAKSTGG